MAGRTAPKSPQYRAAHRRASWAAGMVRFDITRATITSNAPDAWAMFDNQSDTRTIMPEEITGSIAVPGVIDTIVMQGLDAAYLHVVVLDDGVEIWRREIALTNHIAVIDYWEYFTEPILRKAEITVSDLPRIPNPTINVRIVGEDAAVGHIALGKARKLAAQES